MELERFPCSLEKQLPREHKVSRKVIVMANDPKRNLTDADIDALLSKIRSEFYTDLGRGFWAMAWRGIIIVLIAIAAYGALRHG